MTRHLNMRSGAISWLSIPDARTLLTQIAEDPEFAQAAPPVASLLRAVLPLLEDSADVRTSRKTKRRLGKVTPSAGAYAPGAVLTAEQVTEWPEMCTKGQRCSSSGRSFERPAPSRDMSESRSLEHVLGAWRDDAEVLRRHGDVRQAEQLERCADEAGAAAEEYIRWLTEEDARLRSGRSRKWLRRQFSAWERAGQARRDGSRRFYRMLIVPERGNAFAAREAGRDAGLEGGRGA